MEQAFLERLSRLCESRRWFTQGVLVHPVRQTAVWQITELTTAWAFRYIFLLEADEDFGSFDGKFWVHLIFQPHLNNASYGQLAHMIFPDIKFVVRLAPRDFKGQIARTPASVYVSDHNAIETVDARAFRRVMLEVLEEYSNANDIAFSGLAKSKTGLQFQVDRMNRPDFNTRCAEAQAIFLQPMKDGQMLDQEVARAQQEEFKVLLEYLPFRNIAIVTLGSTCSIRINLLTKTPINDISSEIKRKVLDIFWLMRGAVKEDLNTAWTMKLDIDLVTERGVSEEEAGIDRAIQWLEEVRRPSSSAPRPRRAKG